MSIDWQVLQQRAEAQADVLSRRQCLAAGMSESMIQWQVSSLRWVRLHEGVYLTKPGRGDWLGHAMAALLWTQSGATAVDAAFCGRSAGFLWRLESQPPGQVELVVPERRRVVAPSGVRIRRSLRWNNLVDDLAFPWRTTISATVLEIAGAGSAVECLAVVAQAVHKQLVNEGQLRQELLARGGHRYSKILKPVLRDADAGGQSAPELLYVRDVERAHGLPEATRQSRSDAGRRRYHDNEYEEFRLIVEVDGRLGHEQWADRVRDGQRDRQLLAGHRITTRVFWVDVAVRPCETAAEIAAILRNRGWTGPPRRCRRPGCTVLREFG